MPRKPTGKPPGRPKVDSLQFSFRINTELLNLLAQAAAAKGTTKPALVREAIVAYLNVEGQKDNPAQWRDLSRDERAAHLDRLVLASLPLDDRIFLASYHDMALK